MDQEDQQHRQHHLAQLQREWVNCKACGLHETRTQTVFGAGPPDASIMLIAEGPGPEEDKYGVPFIGPAGETLDEILSHTYINRDELFITNMVMCAPPDVRDPTLPEITACWPRLVQQIQIIDPDIIVAFGRFACKQILRDKSFKISEQHGTPRVARIEGYYTAYDIAVMPMLHPSWLRKNYGIEAQGPMHRAVREMRAVRDAANFLHWIRTNNE